MAKIKIVELPAFIEPDEGGDIIPVERCTRYDIEAEIGWTDSIRRRADLRKLLKLTGPRLTGTATVGEVLNVTVGFPPAD